jgi:UDP-N-acetylglucosamine--N-acetylmuramyl-(pentapeptide) pyrophosphoryl-undecaprenol N-acetylglucosamine transferase
VAEDHQTKNAQALADKSAALMIPNSEASARLMKEALELLNDEARCRQLSTNIRMLAKPNAAEEIAREVLGLVGHNHKTVKPAFAKASADKTVKPQNHKN